MNHIVAMQPVRSMELDGKQLDLIRRTVAADTNQMEFDLFMEAARRIGLDPFRKQIYAVVYSKDNAKKRKMSIITGIDGFRAVAARNGTYRPDENEAVIVYDEAEKNDVNKLGIVKATVTAWKSDPAGDWHPVKAVAYWDEYAPLKEIWKYDADAGKKLPSGEFEISGMWGKMPRVMITKCAEALAIRKGWPEDLSGVYSPEEMAQAEAADMSASETADAYQEERRLQATGTANTIMFLWDVGEDMEAVPMGELADRIVAYFDPKAERPLGQLEAFLDRNRAPMNEFWSRSKSDALEVKQVVEARLAKLASDNEQDNADDPSLPTP